MWSGDTTTVTTKATTPIDSSLHLENSTLDIHGFLQSNKRLNGLVPTKIEIENVLPSSVVTNDNSNDDDDDDVGDDDDDDDDDNHEITDESDLGFKENGTTTAMDKNQNKKYSKKLDILDLDNNNTIEKIQKKHKIDGAINLSTSQTSLVERPLDNLGHFDDSSKDENCKKKIKRTLNRHSNYEITLNNSENIQHSLTNSCYNFPGHKQVSDEGIGDNENEAISNKNDVEKSDSWNCNLETCSSSKTISFSKNIEKRINSENVNFNIISNNSVSDQMHSQNKNNQPNDSESSDGDCSFKRNLNQIETKNNINDIDENSIKNKVKLKNISKNNCEEEVKKNSDVENESVKKLKNINELDINKLVKSDNCDSIFKHNETPTAISPRYSNRNTTPYPNNSNKLSNRINQNCITNVHSPRTNNSTFNTNHSQHNQQTSYHQQQIQMQQLLQQHVFSPNQLQQLIKNHSFYLQQQQHQNYQTHSQSYTGPTNVNRHQNSSQFDHTKKQIEQTMFQIQESLQMNLIQQTHLIQQQNTINSENVAPFIGLKQKTKNLTQTTQQLQQQLAIQQQELIQQLQLTQRQYLMHHQGIGAMQPAALLLAQQQQHHQHYPQDENETANSGSITNREQQIEPESNVSITWKSGEQQNHQNFANILETCNENVSESINGSSRGDPTVLNIPNNSTINIENSDNNNNNNNNSNNFYNCGVGSENIITENRTDVTVPNIEGNQTSESDNLNDKLANILNTIMLGSGGSGRSGLTISPSRTLHTHNKLNQRINSNENIEPNNNSNSCKNSNSNVNNHNSVRSTSNICGNNNSDINGFSPINGTINYSTDRYLSITNPIEGDTKLFGYLLYGNGGLCQWPGCEKVYEDFQIFVKHLNINHRVNEKSATDLRVQRNVVSQLEVQLRKEKDILQAMLNHLDMTSAMSSSSTPISPLSNSHVPHHNHYQQQNQMQLHQQPINHTNNSNSSAAMSPKEVKYSETKKSSSRHHYNNSHQHQNMQLTSIPLRSPLHNSPVGPIRRRITDKSLALAGGLPYMLERAGLDVQQEIQRNREFYKNADVRPPFTYASLIRQSIIESPDKQLTLNEIYNWFQNTFCYFRRNAATWKNAVRHNLSLHKCFMRVENVKGAVWTVDEIEFCKRRPQRCSAPSSSSSTTSSSAVAAGVPPSNVGYEDDFGSFWMVDDNEFVKRRHLSRGRPRKYEPSQSPSISSQNGDGIGGNSNICSENNTTNGGGGSERGGRQSTSSSISISSRERLLNNNSNYNYEHQSHPNHQYHRGINNQIIHHQNHSTLNNVDHHLISNTNINHHSDSNSNLNNNTNHHQPIVEQHSDIENHHHHNNFFSNSLSSSQSLQNRLMHSPNIYGAEMTNSLQNFWACPPNLLDDSTGGYLTNRLLRQADKMQSSRCHSVSPSPNSAYHHGGHRLILNGNNVHVKMETNDVHNQYHHPLINQNHQNLVNYIKREKIINKLDEDDEVDDDDDDCEKLSHHHDQIDDDEDEDGDHVMRSKRMVDEYDDNDGNKGATAEDLTITNEHVNEAEFVGT